MTLLCFRSLLKIWARGQQYLCRLLAVPITVKYTNLHTIDFDAYFIRIPHETQPLGEWLALPGARRV